MTFSKSPIDPNDKPLGWARSALIVLLILAAAAMRIRAFGSGVARGDTVDQQITAIRQDQAALKTAQAAIVKRLDAAGIPAAIEGPIELTNLAGARLKPGKSYALKPGAYVLPATLGIPAKATLDVTGSTITYQSSAKYGIAVMFNGPGATLRGGTWVAGNATPLDAKKPEQDTFANSQRVWDIAAAATDTLVENVMLASDDVAHEWNSGYTGYNPSARPSATSPAPASTAT